MSTINIDFNILDSTDTRQFLVADNSDWGLIEDRVSIIEITVPGFSAPVVNYFTKGAVNNFNSINLNLNCPTGDCEDVEYLDLPDGIYTVVVKGSPDTYYREKKYIRTAKFELSLSKLYLELYSNQCHVCRDKKELLIDIELMIKAAKANVINDNCKEAQKLFYEAQELLDETKRCKTCI